MVNLNQQTFLKPLLHFTLLLGLLYMYARLIETYGGFSTEFLHLQWLEIGFVLLLYGLLYLALKPVRWRVILAAVPLFLIYLVHDVFYLVYGKVFRFVNLSEVPELLQILPPGYAILLVLVFTVPLLLIARSLNYRRPLPLLAGIAPLFLLALLIKTTPAAFADSFQSLAHEIVKYSDAKSVENNGRLAMLLYREAQRTLTVEKIDPYRDRAKYEQELQARVAHIKPHLQPRNVHLIVLESFLDPRLFRDLHFSRPPVHPAFEKLFGDKLGLSLAPVFGGATAQAEFEVLCGVPAFEKLSSVEFNAFTGAPAYCLPGVLDTLGYRSVASNAYKPNFFNAQAGYAGMGFAEQHFPVEFYAAQPTYLKFGDPGVEEYLFDADLFAQNLAFVKQHLQQGNQPLFNYVMTIYGHTPHDIDPRQRPEIIQVQSDYPDDHLQRATNQFYYRTQAIAEYVEKLLALDKNSLIILISDHVPPLRNGPNTFNALHYMDNREYSYYYNRIAILENGTPVKYAPLHHYELPDLILDSLTGGQHCATHSCAWLGEPARPREAYLEEYLVLMAHASE